MNKFNIILLLLQFLLNGLLSGFSGDKNSGNTDSLTTVSFSVVGDLMCHTTQFEWARVKNDSFDFRPNFEFIKPFLDSADLTIGNLETVINPKLPNYDGYPVFNTPEEYLDALKYSGFDLLATANNHATDGRKEGIVETINAIKKYGMDYTGTFLNREDRDSLRIHNVDGVTYTVLSYSYGLNINNLRASDKYMVNLIDTTLIKTDIDNYREAGTDLVIVYLHAGSENAFEPTKYQRMIVDRLIEYGADIIFSSSPHVLQPIDLYENINSSIDTILVAYSLGNFISNQRWRYSDGGVILNFTIMKNNITGKLKLNNVNYLPVWVYKGLTPKGYQYIIVPSEGYQNLADYKFLDESSIIKMKEFTSDAQQILNRYSSLPKMVTIHKDESIASDTIKVRDE